MTKQTELPRDLIVGTFIKKQQYLENMATFYSNGNGTFPCKFAFRVAF